MGGSIAVGDCGMIGKGSYGYGQGGQAIVNGFDVEYLNPFAVGMFLKVQAPNDSTITKFTQHV